MALEVADDPLEVEAGVLGGELLAAREHGGLADVERHVARERLGVAHRVEEYARLRCVAGPELDELGRSGAGDDVARVPREDRALGPRRVVLRQLADPLEQLGPARVVEVLRRQLLERPGQPVEHVLGDCGPAVVVEVAIHA